MRNNFRAHMSKYKPAEHSANVQKVSDYLMKPYPQWAYTLEDTPGFIRICWEFNTSLPKEIVYKHGWNIRGNGIKVAWEDAKRIVKCIKEATGVNVHLSREGYIMVPVDTEEVA